MINILFEYLRTINPNLSRESFEEMVGEVNNNQFIYDSQGYLVIHSRDHDKYLRDIFDSYVNMILQTTNELYHPYIDVNAFAADYSHENEQYIALLNGTKFLDYYIITYNPTTYDC